MSTHSIDVVQITIEAHPNADKLGIVSVGGYQVCVDKTQWKDGELAAYVPPDYLVPIDRPEFSWLADPNKVGQTHHRVKVKKLRGIYSQGLLVPAPAGSQVGDNVMEQLAIKRYEPAEPTSFKGECAATPPGFGHAPKYDLESFQKYSKSLIPGERVIITEKIHGANARFLATEEGEATKATPSKITFHCGSRTEWKMYDAANPWWRVLEQNVDLKLLLASNPGKIFYGEIYGWIQELRYGAQPGQVWVKFFDIFDGEKFLNWDEFCAIVPADLRVPLLYDGPFADVNFLGMAEGKSTLADHIREGCVVKPATERWDRRTGRVALKIVGNGYLEKASG
jgi:RNA ligase (TIGR02306 family)